MWCRCDLGAELQSSYLDAELRLNATLGSTVALSLTRSPHFENTQLRRKLTLGFRAEGAGAERQLCACGDDAATFIIPDGVSKVDLSAVVFREDGMHHGKPCFRAAPAPPAVVAAPHWTVWLARPAVNAGLCIALGFAVGVAASRRRA